MIYLLIIIYVFAGMVYLRALIEMERIKDAVNDLSKALKLEAEPLEIFLKDNPILKIVVVLIWPLIAVSPWVRGIKEPE